MSLVSDHETDKKYTLVTNGRPQLDMDNIEYLRELLCVTGIGANPYILYQETGHREYEDTH